MLSTFSCFEEDVPFPVFRRMYNLFQNHYKIDIRHFKWNEDNYFAYDLMFAIALYIV